jgi:hypothetical protein
VKWYRLEKVSQELGTGFQVEELELEVCDIQRAKPTSTKTTRQEKRKEKLPRVPNASLKTGLRACPVVVIISTNASLSVRTSFCTHLTPVETMKENHR